MKRAFKHSREIYVQHKRQIESLLPFVATILAAVVVAVALIFPKN